MPGKRPGLPAPIDRPLSRAYLRKFLGWTTMAPPGLADPSSLRQMENVSVTRMGAVKIRPAMRSIMLDNLFLDSYYGVTMVGTFEPFFTDDGRKAILFAVREVISGVTRVSFRAGIYDSTAQRYRIQTLTAGALFSVPQGMATVAFSAATTYVTYVQIDNRIFALSDNGESMRLFSVGANKFAKKLQRVAWPRYLRVDAPTLRVPTTEWIDGPQVTKPTEDTPDALTLVSPTASENVYNFAYFYTFSNEIGESGMSFLETIKVRRGWSAWRKGGITGDAHAPDQIAAVLTRLVYDGAVADGAISWNLYMLTWSDQSAVPVEGVLLKTISLQNGATYDTAGWATHTPQLEGTDTSAPLPSVNNLYNYSNPSTASQGLVAGDRLILVNDKKNPAVIRWSSNLQGDYINFSASKGGGYKTLTSGNLYIPGCAKLWQNPQSVDTITIPCVGIDGYSTSYYMAPNTSVTGQTGSTVLMGFEETTATPGTVSPYGCEVLNNALYHPLDSELMKSTASNYNISHKPMTDAIQDKWVELRKKDDIVSCQMDNRLYFVVNNPEGLSLEVGCKGNEIWVYDTSGGETGSWSRWLIQAIAMRKLEIAGKLYLAVCRPDGIYIMDPLEVYDTVNVEGHRVLTPIPWKLETNTQGANRQHDAWAHLQQMNVTFGNLYGTVRYGIRSWDMNGKRVEVTKTFRDLTPSTRITRMKQQDSEDYLLIRRDLRDWRFFAESVPDLPSYGQVTLAQYRYTPVTVNVGYEYGSVETFEYGRATENWTDRTTDNGVPQPMIDPRGHGSGTVSIS